MLPIIADITGQIEAIDNKRSAQVKRLRSQRAAYEQRLKQRTEEKEREVELARRCIRIKLIVRLIRDTVAKDVFEAIHADLTERLPDLPLDKLLA